MDIIYRKDTLYVYLKRNEEFEFDDLERRVKKIMDIYKIDKLVIDTGGEEGCFIYDFESKLSFKDKSRILVR